MASVDLAIQNVTTVGDGNAICRKAKNTLGNSASLSSCTFIGQIKQKPPGCTKDVQKLSQTNKKLCSSGNGTMHNTVTI